MSKKRKQRGRRGRPQSAPSRKRPRKVPAPRPARKPQPRGFWPRLRANRPLFLGSIALAVAALVLLGWLGVRGLRGRSQAPVTLSWPEPPGMAIDTGKPYTATLVTDKGDITIQLFADRAPKTVNSFVFLARQGFYDGVTFHRVLEGFMAQTGDPTGTGGGGPGYRFEDEIDPELKFDRAGIVAMANSGSDTNGSQFFITYGPQSHLNGKHTIFGQVVAGMEVVEALTPRDPSQDPDAPPGDVIRTIRIVEG